MGGKQNPQPNPRAHNGSRVRLPFWRFSCVGFVTRAYETARITLLGEPKPLKTIDDLREIYPSQAERLDNTKFQVLLGVGPGTGVATDQGEAWPVDLVGYLLHSLARTVEAINGENAIPYCPRSGDEYFPRQGD